MTRYSHNTITGHGTPIIVSTSVDKRVTVCMSICAGETWQPQTSYLSSKKRMWPVTKVVHNTGRYDEENYRVKKKKFHWAISDQLENLQFADGIRLPSHDFSHKKRKSRNSWGSCSIDPSYIQADTKLWSGEWARCMEYLFGEDEVTL